MSSITITSGDITAQCDSPESAAALVRLLRGQAPATNGASPEPARAPRKAKAAAEETVTPPEEGASRHGQVKAVILKAVSLDPSPDVRELSRQLYGSEEAPKRNLVRMAFARLEKTGALKKLKDGSWKIV